MGCCSSRQDAEYPHEEALLRELKGAGANTQRKRLRMLCLHGFRTNADIMQIQTIGLQQAFDADRVDLVYVNAAYPASGPAYDDVIALFGREGPYYEWWSPQDTKIHESVGYLARQIDRLGPIDVLVGFSQGATMATHLISMYQTTCKPLPFKAVVLVCGVDPVGGKFPDLLNIPSIHILGEHDECFASSKQLMERYVSHGRQEFIHPEDHKFPALPHGAQIYDQVAAALLKWI